MLSKFETVLWSVFISMSISHEDADESHRQEYDKSSLKLWSTRLADFLLFWCLIKFYGTIIFNILLIIPTLFHCVDTYLKESLSL